jgi:Fe-Mn family superoxide dismutase
MLTRRAALKTTALAAAATALTPRLMAQNSPTAPASASEPFTLPPLPYAVDALEPHLDARTMEIHHDRHHAAYVAGLNKAWQAMAWSGQLPTFQYLETHWLSDPKFLASNTAIRNQGGGHYNHTLFWQMMKKDGGGQPTAELAKAVDAAFGSFSAFKDSFTKAALGRFGSGWAWLVWNGAKLEIGSTANQDCPLTGKALAGCEGAPLLGLDVWEHAYYLKYQNKRADYITAWWNVVNWDFVTERFLKAKGS